MEYSEQIEHFGEPCSIDGTQPALLVDAEEKGTYWMCASCMFETIKDKMKLEAENEAWFELCRFFVGGGDEHILEMRNTYLPTGGETSN